MRLDYYQLLDIEESASAAEIKAAYRRQAKRFHPDLHRDNPVAEERFKLVAEAYRTLGDTERKADYDSWLERQRRLAAAPELAAMPRHTRVSARHAYERRNRRRPARSPHARPFLLKPRSKWPLVQYVGFYVVCIVCLVPWFITLVNRGNAPRAMGTAEHTDPGVSPLDEETQMKKLAEFTEGIRQRAAAGVPDAQCRYGSFLYHGTGGVKQDRAAARDWWRKAAEQGFLPAVQYLEKSKEEIGSAPSAEKSAAPVQEEK